MSSGGLWHLCMVRLFEGYITRLGPGYKTIKCMKKQNVAMEYVHFNVYTIGQKHNAVSCFKRIIFYDSTKFKGQDDPGIFEEGGWWGFTLKDRSSKKYAKYFNSVNFCSFLIRSTLYKKFFHCTSMRL